MPQSGFAVVTDSPTDLPDFVPLATPPGAPIVYCHPTKAPNTGPLVVIDPETLRYLVCMGDGERTILLPQPMLPHWDWINAEAEAYKKNRWIPAAIKRVEAN